MTRSASLYPLVLNLLLVVGGCESEPLAPVEFEATARLRGPNLVVKIDKLHPFEVLGETRFEFDDGGHQMNVPSSKLPEGATEVEVHVKENNPVDKSYHRGPANKTVPIDVSMTWEGPSGFVFTDNKKLMLGSPDLEGSLRWSFNSFGHGFFLQNLRDGTAFGRPLTVENNQARVVIDLTAVLAQEPVTWLTEQKGQDPVTHAFTVTATDYSGAAVEHTITIHMPSYDLGRAAREQVMKWATAPAARPTWSPTGKAVAVTDFGDEGLSIANAGLKATDDAKTVADVAYVARIAVHKERKKKGSCTYPGGARDVFVADADLIVYELRSGTEVARKVIKGRRYGCPKMLDSSVKALLHKPNVNNVLSAAKAAVAKLKPADG